MKGWHVEVAGAVDAKNAPTAPWKTAEDAVFHSSHKPYWYQSSLASHFLETSQKKSHQFQSEMRLPSPERCCPNWSSKTEIVLNS
jgi:hypothetical protein